MEALGSEIPSRVCHPGRGLSLEILPVGEYGEYRFTRRSRNKLASRRKLMHVRDEECNFAAAGMQVAKLLVGNGKRSFRMLNVD